MLENVTPVVTLVKVQVVEGKPLKITLPVATVQVGWFITPTIGAAWVGTGSITTFEVAKELQDPLETEKV